MKTATALIAGMTLFLSCAAPQRVEAKAEVSFDVFYEALDPYGAWIDVADYGYCWQPRDVDPEWRPYTDGQWVYTEAGWTWVSDEPWGWATYHYGRWLLLEEEGWVWWPDTQWAPAWVSWRYNENDGYIGWAPLPPEARWRVDVGFGPWVDGYYDIGPSCYTFVESRHLCSPRVREWAMPRRQNVTFIQNTVNITNISFRQTTIYNGGPRYESIAQISETPVRRLKLERRADVEFDPRAMRERPLRDRVQEDRLHIVAPAIEARATDLRPMHVAKKLEQATVDRGWARTGDNQAAQQAREKMKRESAAVTPPTMPLVPSAEQDRRKEHFAPEERRVPKALPGPDMPPVPKALPGPDNLPPGKKDKDEDRNLPGRPQEMLPPEKPKHKDEERLIPRETPQSIKPGQVPKPQNEPRFVPPPATQEQVPRVKPKPKDEERIVPPRPPQGIKPVPKVKPQNEPRFVPPSAPQEQVPRSKPRTNDEERVIPRQPSQDFQPKPAPKPKPQTQEQFLPKKKPHDAGSNFQPPQRVAPPPVPKENAKERHAPAPHVAPPRNQPPPGASPKHQPPPEDGGGKKKDKKNDH